MTSLQHTISEHLDYIESTTKGPVCPLTPDRDLRHVMAEEEQKVCLCMHILYSHMCMWGVTIHWTGLLDWTTGLDYWTHPKWYKMPSPAFFSVGAKLIIFI